MDFTWWFFWIILLVWIFAILYDIPGQRNRNPDALAILQLRFAAGKLGKDEYDERKKIIETDKIKRT